MREQSLKNSARLWRFLRMPRLPFSPKSVPQSPDSEATQRTSDSQRWMSRLSTTKCQRVAKGSVARTPWRCARKSASVRVAAHEGAIDSARGDIAAEDERAGAVTDVLEFAPRNLPRRQRQVGVLALQRLYAGEFVGAHDPLPSHAQRRGLAIERANVVHLGIEVLVVYRRGQPVADSVRLEIPLFSKRAAWRPEIRSTIPRRLISSAIWRPLH
jgi:hypothetical protein